MAETKTLYLDLVPSAQDNLTAAIERVESVGLSAAGAARHVVEPYINAVRGTVEYLGTDHNQLLELDPGIRVEARRAAARVPHRAGRRPPGQAGRPAPDQGAHHQQRRRLGTARRGDAAPRSGQGWHHAGDAGPSPGQAIAPSSWDIVPASRCT